MKLYRMLLALGTVLIAGTAIATADTLQLGSYATGAPSLGNSNTAMNYAGFSSTSTPSSGTVDTFSLNPAPLWGPTIPSSTWVGFASTAGPAATVDPATGYYTFTTTFAANGSYSGFMQILADDTAEVLLNGVVIVPPGALGTDAYCADVMPNCTMIDLVALTGLNLSGTNTLTFVVQQGSVPTPGRDPSGLDFNAMLIDAPEPSPLMLVGIGLIGTGALLRRKRA